MLEPHSHLGEFQRIAELLRSTPVDHHAGARFARITSALSAVVDGILLLDAERRVTFANAAAERILDVSGTGLQGRVFGRSSWTITAVDGASLMPSELPFHRAMKGEAVSGFELALIRAADGRRFVLETSWSPVLDGRNRPNGMVASLRDVTARRSLDDATALLAEVGAALVESLDVERTLETVASCAVPRVADFAVVYLLDGEELRCAAAVHRDVGMESTVRALRDVHRPSIDDADSLIAAVCRTGQPRFYDRVAPGALEKHVGTPLVRRILTALRPRSMLMVPMKARGGTLGVIVLSTSTSARQYDRTALDLAQDLGRQAGLALDNAHLYERARREVEQRHHLEDALRVSEGKYRELLEQTPGAIAVVHASDLRVLFVNQQACAMAGATAEQIVGQRVTDFMDPEELEERPIDWPRLLRGETPVDERTLVRGDGRRVPVAVGCRLFGDGRLFITLFDARERSRTLAAAARLATIVDSSQDAIMDVSLDGTITDWNAGAERIFGYTAAEAVGRPVAIFSNAAHHDEQSDVIARTARGERIETYRTERRRRDGRSVVVEVTPAPLHDELGRVVGISATIRDVTEQVAAEQALEQRTRELADHVKELSREKSRRQAAEEEVRRSEAYFRSLIENARDIVALVNPEGVLRYVAPSVQDVLGYDRGALIGRSIFELIHEEDRPRARERLRLDVERAEEGPSRLITLRVRHRDRGWRLLEVLTRSLLEHPAVRGIVIHARDATERLALEDQLRHAQKMEAIGRLAGGLAHDFNNLLTAIAGHAGLLLEDLASDDPRREDADEIRRTVERATALTRQLLAFSRKEVVEASVIDLNRVVVEIGVLLRRLIGEDITTEVDLDPDVPRVLADADQIGQVLMNLAVNARDAMPTGGRLHVATSSAELDRERARALDVEPGRFAVVAVRDTGVGIAPDVLPHIFEPFFTTKEPGRGTGLGLATVYGIVTSAGGGIAVESGRGTGTEFRLYLPAAPAVRVDRADPPADAPAATGRDAPAPAGSLAQDAVAASERDTEGRTGPRVVLVVEDEPLVRTLARRVLSRSGYVVLEAESGAAALGALEMRPADVVVTDFELPDMTGVDLARRLRGMRDGTRIIFTSGHPRATLEARSELDPGAMFLEKPYEARALLDAVAAALRGP